MRKTNSFFVFLMEEDRKVVFMDINSKHFRIFFGVFFYFQNATISHKIHEKYTIKGLENIDIKDIYNNPDKIEHIHEIKVAFNNMMTNQDKGIK